MPLKGDAASCDYCGAEIARAVWFKQWGACVRCWISLDVRAITLARVRAAAAGKQDT